MVARICTGMMPEACGPSESFKNISKKRSRIATGESNASWILCWASSEACASCVSGAAARAPNLIWSSSSKPLSMVRVLAAWLTRSE